MEAKNLLKKLEQHPLVRKIITDEENESLSLREKAISEIATFEKFKEDAMKAHERDLAEAEKAVVENQARLQISLRRRGKINHEHHVKIVDYDNTIRHLKGVLLTSYSQLIDAFISEMLNMDDQLRNRLLIGHSKGKANVFTDSKPKFISTNLVPIKKARKYISDALIEAEDMKLLAIPEADVKKRLDELFLNIPNRDINSICEFEEKVPDTTILKNSIKPKGRSGLITPSWATWGTIE
jgi:hypothetical protein